MTGLTAAALIEAIAEREWRWYWDHNGDNADVQWSEVGAEAADGWRERARAIAAVSLPLIADALEASRLTIEGTHHFHGERCLCGFSSAVARERTEHITGACGAAEFIRSLLEADDDH